MSTSSGGAIQTRFGAAKPTEGLVNIHDAALAAGTAFLASLVLTPIVVAWLLRTNVLDHPSERSLHSAPTPRGGGLGPAVASLVVATSFPNAQGIRVALILVAGTFMLLGLVEDLRGIPTSWRLATQVVLALTASPLLATTSSNWKPLLIPLIAIWLVAFVNAFNFMDGIDGISAIQVVITGLVWFTGAAVRDLPFLACAGLVVAAAALGFAPFNFPAARVFLGDSGSYFFGAWLAAATVAGIAQGLTPEFMMAPLAICIADTFTTFLRRLKAKKRWIAPHREHVYQQIVAGGWSHARTTLSIGGLLAVCSLLGSLTLLGSNPLRVAADIALVLVLAGYLRFPRLNLTRTAVNPT